ncbi:MAG: SIR2 family protein [Proteobacteria bacterium]|nr:SIR2 family protein [Pseudomonadota bacterium]
MIELPTGTNPEIEAERLVLNGCYVAFIGAGMSNPPGKQWRETVHDIARRCNVKTNNKTLYDLIDECQEANSIEYERAFRELVPKHVPTSRTALNYLLRLPFKSYVTTNFDPWLHNLSTSTNIERVHAYPDLPLHKGLSKAIYYLHGYYDSDDSMCDPKRLVFGTKTFEQAYGYESLLPGFLLNLFTYEHILFLGFNPSEKNISDLLKKANSIRKSFIDVRNLKKPKRYIFFPLFNVSDKEKQAKWDAEIEQLTSLEIIPILYEAEGEDYIGLEKILYNWVQHGELKNRPAPFKAGFDLFQPQDNIEDQQ